MSENHDLGKEAAFTFVEIMQGSSTIFYRCDFGGHFPVRYMSPNVEQVLGFKEEAFKADDNLWLDRIHKNDRDKVIKGYNELGRSTFTVIEFRFKHKEGHYIWLQDEVKLTVDHDGEPESVVGSSREITLQKEAETKLKELNKTLEERIKKRTSSLEEASTTLKEQRQTMQLQKLAIDNLNDMVVITKAPKDNPLNSEIVFVNRAFEEFTGYQAEEVLGEEPKFLHGTETSPIIVNRIEEQLLASSSLREEFINYKKDGTPYWVELDMAPFLTAREEYNYWVGINRDITQRKEAEQKLEESEQRYRAITELSFDAIFEVGLDGTILDCNKRACQLSGYSREELVGMNAKKLVPEEYRSEHPEAFSEEHITGDEVWERIYRKKDGTQVPTEVHTQLYNIGEKKRIVAYVRDNTTHKEYENAIFKSLKEKETLLAEIHHRVKNNLAIISGLLEMQVFNTEDEKLLNKLRESQARIQSIAMVHEKLYSSDSFSEIAIDQYIKDLVERIVSSMANFNKNIRMQYDMDPVTLTVGQAIPCGLILNELITNCFKHAFKDQQEGQIWTVLKRKDENLHLVVKDNGSGLADDFDIHTESSLGMTLINTLIQQLNGELSVSTNGGSNFEITFEIDQ
ncbi:PAS domain-containing sensor histidine kinase [Fodinibius salsisoli]|uniref:histidine kinase n=1 Tax=Fodinibius salsisoli TaxID=2820877 RepID=A0ABT3PI57_9BACT|nr:PAS domain S-box protein [Fodinibius salsisoli]MCW9705618.1 PAS domain S-box protein [Fodinibius salsisoli]